ncbi:MAG: hypothetical protein ACYCY2_06510 [Acidithiobacillus ferriphilus]
MSGRYYEIVVRAPVAQAALGLQVSLGGVTVSGTPLIIPNGTDGQYGWQSHPGGIVDPAAQNVSFDVMVLPAAVAHGASFVTIEGIGLHDLSEVNNFKPTPIGPWTFELYAGMKGGLPLSARQPAPGLLFGGIVLDAFGNWQGTEMNLSFLIAPGQYSLESPGNLVLDWQKGQDLSAALATMLQQAYPHHILLMEIQSGMVNKWQFLHYSSTLKQMADLVLQSTKSWGGVKSYPGVSIVVQNNTVRVFDGTQSGTKPPIQISYDSLVGQPTWIDAVTVAITTIMRSDISVGDEIEMPAGMSEMPGAVFTQAAIGNAFLNQKVMFSGKFTVIGVRHCGDFRSDDGAQWVTVIHAAAVAPA